MINVTDHGKCSEDNKNVILFPLLFHELHSFRINLFLVTYESHLRKKFEFHSNAEGEDLFASAFRQDTNLPLPAII